MRKFSSKTKDYRAISGSSPVKIEGKKESLKDLEGYPEPIMVESIYTIVLHNCVLSSQGILGHDMSKIVYQNLHDCVLCACGRFIVC